MVSKMTITFTVATAALLVGRPGVTGFDGLYGNDENFGVDNVMYNVPCSHATTVPCRDGVAMEDQPVPTDLGFYYKVAVLYMW